MSLQDYAEASKYYDTVMTAGGPVRRKVQKGMPSLAEVLSDMVKEMAEPNRKKRLYLAGSLRNDQIVNYHNDIQSMLGDEWTVFSDWAATHPHADDNWRDYYKARGFTYKEALKEPASINVFQFDKKHIDMSDAMLVVYPAGKSAHLELGYHIGKGKPGFILLDNPDRWDVMLQFATGVTDDTDELIGMIQNAECK